MFWNRFANWQHCKIRSREKRGDNIHWKYCFTSARKLGGIAVKKKCERENPDFAIIENTKPILDLVARTCMSNSCADSGKGLDKSDSE